MSGQGDESIYNDPKAIYSLLTDGAIELLKNGRGSKSHVSELVNYRLITYRYHYHSLNGRSMRVGYTADYTDLGRAVIAEIIR
jgi:hypothetical protein